MDRAVQFVTPGHLRSEVCNELASHGGRLSMLDLPDLLNVDLANIETAVHELTAGSSMLLVNGQLISRSYIDSLINEIAQGS